MDPDLIEFLAAPGNYRRALYLAEAVQLFRDKVTEQFTAKLRTSVLERLPADGFWTVANWAGDAGNAGLALGSKALGTTLVVFGYNKEKGIIGPEPETSEPWIGIWNGSGASDTLGQNLVAATRAIFVKPRLGGRDWAVYEAVPFWPLTSDADDFRAIIGDNARVLSDRVADAMVSLGIAAARLC